MSKFFDLLGPDDVRDAHTPLYLTLRNAIRALIENGTLAPGEGVPGEREIADRLDVSRVTVRRAIAGLVEEGALTHRRGSGTFVAQSTTRIEQPLSRLTSFTEDMLSRGRRPTAVWLERTTAYCTPEEAMAFGLSSHDKVTRLNRLRSSDGRPLAVELASVPATLFPDPMEVEHSLYAAMAKRGIMPARAIQRINARALPAREAALLEVAPGDPALYIERVSRLADGTVVEFTRSYYRSDAYDFVADLTLPAEGAAA